MPQTSKSNIPYTLDLSALGYIRGTTHLTPPSQSPSPSTRNNTLTRALCHYFGGIPYALPPTGPFRWTRPRPLPPCHRYGTRAAPADFSGKCGVCPQPSSKGDGVDDVSGDEDCLQLNVWLPAGRRPVGGWPVLFYIHGGFLQFGSPNGSDFRALLGETALQCIIVAPAYRVNLFGFLSGFDLDDEAAVKGQTCGNYGFWDQRLALEWTHKNISYFGGDAGNITVSGYSAGAHSTFHQLAHDLFHPNPAKHIIKRAIMFSNGPGMQPKSLSESNAQYNQLLAALKIPTSLSPSARLAHLRNIDPTTLLAAANTLSIHEFRAVSDGQFVCSDLFAAIDSGLFALRLQQRGITLQLGECRDEHFLYGAWRPPSARHGFSLRGLQQRLCADYPAAVVARLLPLYCPDGQLPVFHGQRCASWDEAFGRIYADLQIHAMQRGFVAALARNGKSTASLIRRYRVEWRAECAVRAVPREWGVTHVTDLAIWFWGNGWGKHALREDEREVARRFAEPFVQSVLGETGDWEARAPKEVRRLRPDGKTDIWVDQDWERGLTVWDVVRGTPVKKERLQKL